MLFLPAMSAISLNPVKESCTLLFTFFLLWLSEAERKTTISSSFASTALNAPFALGTNAAKVVLGFLFTFSRIIAASANCGIAFGDTKDETSIL